MASARTFLGFSSSDYCSYLLMAAWQSKRLLHTQFVECQLHTDGHNADEAYVKRRCRNRIDVGGTYALLIGEDTHRQSYVAWEAEVALEKRCRIIGINLNGAREMLERTCPASIRNAGALFVPFSAKIIAYALENFERQEARDWHCEDRIYEELGYCRLAA